MIDAKCTVDLGHVLDIFDQEKVDSAINATARKKIKQQCNEQIPKQTGNLRRSASVSGTEITWSAPYASRVFHTNKNGGNKWDSRAWRRHKRAWCNELARQLTSKDN